MGWDKMQENLGFLTMIGKNWVSPRFWTKLGFSLFLPHGSRQRASSFLASQ
jgi:hypothetical protein